MPIQRRVSPGLIAVDRPEGRGPLKLIAIPIYMREMGTLLACLGLVEWPSPGQQPPKAEADMHTARAEHPR